MVAAVETMFYNSQNGKPWHRLGEAFDGVASAAQALTLSGLDWQVVKVPQSHEWNGETRISQGSHAIIRTSDGRQLSNVGVGDRYEPIQNADAFDFLDSLVDTGEAKYETAGSLLGGQRIFLLAKVPATVEPVNGDPIEEYLCAFNSHDGSKSMGVLFTPVRVVCNNTLNAAIGGAKRVFKIRHTKNWVAKVEQAREALGFAIKYYDLFAQEMREFAARDVSFDETKVYVDKLIELPDTKQKGRIETVNEKRNELFRLIEEGKGTDIPGVKGTVYGLYNAAAEYADHRLKLRGEKLSPEQMSTKRADSILFDGNIQKFKDRAYSLSVATMKGELVTA
jgi:phage/plasmid-like protein (TIGR03299 family)